MRQILILKLGALGDVILATSLVDAICRHHAQAQVTLLTTPAFAPLFEAQQELRVCALPRKGAGAMLAMLRLLRGGGFERVYDLQSNDRTRWLCGLSGIRERVGNHPHWPYTHHPQTAWHGQQHIFARYVEVLASAGVDAPQPQPLLPASEHTQQRVAEFMRTHDLQASAFCLLHAGASAQRPFKRWPHFAALAEKLQSAGITPVWLGGVEDAEVNRALASDGGIDATGAFDILQLAQLGRSARFAVTNDSGPMHALSAAGIPVFGLFGPSDWQRNHALGQRERVLTGPGYRVEAIDGGGANGLDQLLPETVMAALAKENLTSR